MKIEIDEIGVILQEPAKNRFNGSPHLDEQSGKSLIFWAFNYRTCDLCHWQKIHLLPIRARLCEISFSHELNA